MKGGDMGRDLLFKVCPFNQTAARTDKEKCKIKAY